MGVDEWRWSGGAECESQRVAACARRSLGGVVSLWTRWEGLHLPAREDYIGVKKKKSEKLLTKETTSGNTRKFVPTSLSKEHK